MAAQRAVSHRDWHCPQRYNLLQLNSRVVGFDRFCLKEAYLHHYRQKAKTNTLSWMDGLFSSLTTYLYNSCLPLLFLLLSHSAPRFHSAQPISLHPVCLTRRPPPFPGIPSVTSLYKYITVHTNTSSRNRLLSHLLCTSALDPAKLPSILRAARAALFPGNMPAGPSSLVPPASEAEYRRLRRRCARAVYRAIAPGPGAVRSVVKTFFLGGFGFGSRSQQKNDQKKSSQHQPGRKAQGKGNDNHNKPRGRATKWEGSASTLATSSFTSSSSSTGVGEVGLGPAAWLKNGGPKKDKDRDKTKARDDKKGKNIGSSPSPSTLSSLPAKDQHQQQQRSAPGPVGLAAVSSAFPPASFPSSTTTPITSASNVAVDADASSSLLPRPAVSASAGTNTSLCASRTNNGADDDRRNGKRRLIHKPASHSQAYYYYDINRWNDCGEDEDHYVCYDDIDSDEEWDEDEQAVLREIDRSVLDVFSDAYCNKHLIYGILELVLVRLIPELAERGVGELWAERIPDVVHPV